MYDDPKRALILRSLADTTRKLTLIEKANGAQALGFTVRENFPSPPNPLEVVLPILGDGLDLAHAQVPAQIHVTPWKR